MFNFSLLYVDISFLASILSLLFFFLVWRKRHVVGSKYLMWTAFAIFVYNLAYALDYSATTTEMKVLWSKLEYLSLYNIVPLLFVFIVQYFGILIDVKYRKFYLLWIIPAIIVLLTLTNEHHNLIWSGFGEIDPVTNLMVYHPGPLHGVGIIYQFLLVIVLLIILFQQWLKYRQRSFRFQIEIVAVAIVLPFIGVLFYSSDLNPLPGMDWAPIGSFFSVVLITVSITTSHFLDLIPVARDLVFSLIHDGIMVVDSQTRVVDWNPALEKLIPQVPINLGMSANQIFAAIGVTNSPFMSAEDIINLEVEMETPDKKILDLIISPLIRNNVSDGWLVIFDDETERRMATRALEKANLTLMQKLDEISKLQEKLKEQAIRDPLTGLFNRRFFDEYFRNELIRSIREEKPISLLMLDIDHFKSVNDRFGHEVGDRVLQLLAEILQSMFRKSDVACRFGGEEFLVLLPGLQEDQALNRAEALREKFAQASLEADFLYSQVTISIGVSNYPLHGDTTSQLFRTADKALYRAKDAGRNQVCCYRDDHEN